MKRIFREWELVVQEIARCGFESVMMFILFDVIAMIFAVGVITILCAITEAFIGAPNWPEVVLAWLIIYGLCFHGVIELIAIALCAEELGQVTDVDKIIAYKRQRFDEEI